MNRRFYVAGKFEQAPRVQSLISQLRKMGHRITFDWTTCTHDLYNGNDQERQDYLSYAGEMDLRGTHEADHMIVLQHPSARGTYVEIGGFLTARIFKKPEERKFRQMMLVVKWDPRRTMPEITSDVRPQNIWTEGTTFPFCHLGDTKFFDSDEELVAWVKAHDGLGAAESKT